MLEQKQVLQNAVEKLQIEEELAVAEARETVFAEVGKRSNNNEELPRLMKSETEIDFPETTGIRGELPTEDKILDYDHMSASNIESQFQKDLQHVDDTKRRDANLLEHSCSPVVSSFNLKTPVRLSMQEPRKTDKDRPSISVFADVLNKQNDLMHLMLNNIKKLCTSIENWEIFW